MPRGWWGAVPGGLACHRCEGRLVSGAVPPPAARPLGRVAGVPRSVCPGCGRCGRGDPAPAPQRAPLRAVVARCEGWQKGVPGGGAFHRCEGRLRSGAPPPPTARPLGGLSGSATHVLWARVCGFGGPALSPRPACPVGAACRAGGGRPSSGGERVSGIPCLLLILKTLIAFQKMFPQNCKKVKSTNKEHHKQDQSQNCDSILPNQSIVSKEGLHIDK